MKRWISSCLVLAVFTTLAATASAQSLGRFTWQLQPYCNVVTATVTGVAGVYTVEGFDDQCGAATRAPLTGVATPNPDGTIGFGLNIVTSPGGRGVHVEARISLATLTGPWTDSDGNTGTFAFNQRAAGNPRPVPASASAIPAVFGLQADGGFLAGGTLNTGAIPASGAGTRMMWFPKRAAFRAGSTTGDLWDEPLVGKFSVAIGNSTVASGESSAAFGTATLASGIASLAAGNGTTASGFQSLAVGFQSESRGNESIALGYRTVAAGQASVATGYETAADGAMSLAHGYRARAVGAESIAIGGDSTRNMGVQATGAQAVAIGVNSIAAGDGSVVIGTNGTALASAPGTFVYADRSTPNLLQAFGPNEFHARAAGGVFFYSNPSLGAGVRLAANANAWSSLSDANSKENFRALDDTDVLAKLARMSIREWNYKAQDAAIRHVGPTAQDFHAAFGLGEDPLRISTLDADGVALAAVSALARENATLKAQLAALTARLDALEHDRN